MTDKEIVALKRKYNKCVDKGTKLYGEVQALFAQCAALEEQIQSAEGEDFDGVQLLFAGRFVDV